MSDPKNINAKPEFRLVEFAVLYATFYAACLLFGVYSGENLLLHLFIYSAVVSLSINLSRRWIWSYKSISELSRYMIADAVGIPTGTCAVLLLQSFILASVEVSVAVILSSIVSFFVLGTISPLVRSPKTHKKVGSFAEKPVARV